MKISPAHFVALASALFLSSCALTGASKPTGFLKPSPDRANPETYGYLYYLDGAGGGTTKKNWVTGVREGLIEAGYLGAGEMFYWGTGKGLKADHKLGVNYKREKAHQLAERIEKHVAKHPDEPVGMLGFSAGAAQIVFALEALPEKVKVDTVVLLGASISKNYDLTEMLKRVKGKMHIYTSTHDMAVGIYMAFTGTSDRKYFDKGATIQGFVLPEGANAETRRLYADKIVTTKWNKDFKRDDDHGHHYDNIKMEFIRDHIAPLFMGKSVPGLPGRDGVGVLCYIGD